MSTMDSHLDVFAEAMLDVYQNFQGKDPLELMDYLSSTNNLQDGLSTSILDSNEELVDAIGAESATDDDFMGSSASFGADLETDYLLTELSPSKDGSSQDYEQATTDELYDFTLQQSLFNNFEFADQQQSQYSQLLSGAAAAAAAAAAVAASTSGFKPTASLKPAIDLNSIFTSDLDPEPLSQSVTTRTHSISSLSSISSAPIIPTINTSDAHYLISNKYPQIRKANSVASTSSLSSPLDSVPKLSKKNSGVGNGKRHSDSRLSLNELSLFLKLDNNLAETARREQEILTIFKDDLGFELGLKTWVRDTSAQKRKQLVNDLTRIVEARYHYGYNEETIEVIIRRASYYTMQGRLRRERRNEANMKIGGKIDKINKRNRRN